MYKLEVQDSVLGSFLPTPTCALAGETILERTTAPSPGGTTESSPGRESWEAHGRKSWEHGPHETSPVGTTEDYEDGSPGALP
jgi:hypothetical protein